MSASCYTAVSIKGPWKSCVSKHQVAVKFSGRGGGVGTGGFCYNSSPAGAIPTYLRPVSKWCQLQALAGMKIFCLLSPYAPYFRHRCIRLFAAESSFAGLTISTRFSL